MAARSLYDLQGINATIDFIYLGTHRHLNLTVRLTLRIILGFRVQPWRIETTIHNEG